MPRPTGADGGHFDGGGFDGGGFDGGPSLDASRPRRDAGAMDARLEIDAARDAGRAVDAGGLPRERMTQRYAEVYCDRMQLCPERLDNEAALRTLLADREICIAVMTQYFRESYYDALFEEVDRGEVTYDPVAAQACLVLDPRECSRGFPRDPACARVFVGNRAVGDRCRGDAQCPRSSRCTFDEGATGSCYGRCSAGVALGAACDGYGRRCGEGGFCFFEREGDDEGTCVQLRHVSASEHEGNCGVYPAESGEPGTYYYAWCAVGEWCDAPVEAGVRVGRCRAPITGGAPCASSAEVCEVDYYCLEAQGRCAHYPARTEAGQPCGNREGAGVCASMIGLECDEGRCARVSGGRRDERCLPDYFNVHCIGNLVCSFESETCVVPGAAGAACSSNFECASNVCRANACADDSCPR